MFYSDLKDKVGKEGLLGKQYVLTKKQTVFNWREEDSDDSFRTDEDYNSEDEDHDQMGQHINKLENVQEVEESLIEESSESPNSDFEEEKLILKVD